MSGAGLTQGHIQNAAGLLAHRPAAKEKLKRAPYESRSVVRESVPLLLPTCQMHAATHKFVGYGHANSDAELQSLCKGMLLTCC